MSDWKLSKNKPKQSQSRTTEGRKLKTDVKRKNEKQSQITSLWLEIRNSKLEILNLCIPKEKMENKANPASLKAMPDKSEV